MFLNTFFSVSLRIHSNYWTEQAYPISSAPWFTLVVCQLVRSHLSSSTVPIKYVQKLNEHAGTDTFFIPCLYFHVLKSEAQVTCQVWEMTYSNKQQAAKQIMHYPPPKTKYCWGMLIIVPAAYQTCWTWCLSHNAARGFRFLFISPFDATLIFWCGQVNFWDSSLSCVVNSVLYFSEQIPCSLDMLSKAYERYQTQQTPDSARSIVCYISHWQTSSLCITSSPL